VLPSDGETRTSFSHTFLENPSTSGATLLLSTIKVYKLHGLSETADNCKVSEDVYIDYLMKYQGVKGETIGIIDEFYTLTNELRLPKYEPMELTQCKELEVKFEDKYVEIFNVRFRILDISYFDFLSKYISVLKIIKGNYKGEIKTSSGEGIIYHKIGKIKNLTFSFTKICGKYRLDTPENCIIGDGISFHTKK
jgi:hypothetical protein